MVDDYVEGKVIQESSHQGILALKELLKHQNVDVQLSELSEDFESITTLNSQLQPSFVSSYKHKKAGTQRDLTYEEVVSDEKVQKEVITDFRK